MIKTDEFLLAYGDDVADINLEQLVDQHRKYGPIATLTIVKLISEFGIVKVSDDTGLVKEFKEKPILNEWMNGGFMAMNRRIFDYLDEGELEQEVFHALLKNKLLGAYKHDGKWKAMNTLKDHTELTSLWNSGKAFWKIWKE